MIELQRDPSLKYNSLIYPQARVLSNDFEGLVPHVTNINPANMNKLWPPNTQYQ